MNKFLVLTVFSLSASAFGAIDKNVIHSKVVSAIINESVVHDCIVKIRNFDLDYFEEGQPFNEQVLVEVDKGPDVGGGADFFISPNPIQLSYVSGQQTLGEIVYVKNNRGLVEKGQQISYLSPGLTSSYETVIVLNMAANKVLSIKHYKHFHSRNTPNYTKYWGENCTGDQ